jgi:hypothetical protein
MKLEQRVTSVELSNKLHELGVTTPSQYYRDWTGAEENEIESWGQDDGDYCPDNVNCYTVAELGEMLPSHDCGVTPSTPDNPPEGYLDGIEVIHTHENEKWVSRFGEDTYFDHIPALDSLPVSRAKTEADARAKMLIYLIENKLITL